MLMSLIGPNFSNMSRKSRSPVYNERPNTPTTLLGSGLYCEEKAAAKHSGEDTNVNVAFF